MNRIKILCAFLAILAFGCGDSSNSETSEKEYPVNIIILLDLSDRISLHKHQDAKQQIYDDIHDCRVIIDVVYSILDKKRYRGPKLKLQFFVVDQPGFVIDFDDQKRLLSFYHNINEIRNSEDFENIEDIVIDTIYKSYIDTLCGSEERFPGADIWAWFRNKSKDALIKNHRNYIICITDGLLQFDNVDGRPKGSYMKNIDKLVENPTNWEEEIEKPPYKLIAPDGIKFKSYTYDVQFLLIGIKYETQENIITKEKIIRAIWKNWLSSMGIDNPRFLHSRVQENAIREFLSIKVKNSELLDTND